MGTEKKEFEMTYRYSTQKILLSISIPVPTHFMIFSQPKAIAAPQSFWTSILAEEERMAEDHSTREVLAVLR